MQPLMTDPTAVFGTPQIGGKTPEEAAFLARLVAVRPSARQLSHSRLPYYSFIHFGMNTMKEGIIRVVNNYTPQVSTPSTHSAPSALSAGENHT